MEHSVERHVRATVDSVTRTGFVTAAATAATAVPATVPATLAAAAAASGITFPEPTGVFFHPRRHVALLVYRRRNLPAYT